MKLLGRLILSQPLAEQKAVGPNSLTGTHVSSGRALLKMNFAQCVRLYNASQFNEGNLPHVLPNIISESCTLP